MFSRYLFIFVCVQECYSSVFILDRDDCSLSTRNHSLIIDLTRTYSYDESIDNYKFYFSLCPKRLKECPKNSFICSVDRTGKAVNLGSEVSVNFSEGLYNVALKSEHGSGNVYIMCTQNGDQPPLFEKIYQPSNSSFFFEYSIKWLSSSSCPLMQYKTQNSCVLYTKEQSYDLRPLQYSSDIFVIKGSEKYLINLCRDVNYKGCENSSVCAIRNGIAHPIAKTEGSILQHIESRGLVLNYQNIDGGGTSIHFTCDSNKTKPLVQLVEKYDHEIEFSIKTDIICPPVKMNCLVTQNSESAYDLSSLNLLKDNWEIIEKNGNKLIFNVCGSLNYVPYLTCSGGPYYACLVDKSNNTLALGYKSTTKVLRHGLISLEITGHTVADEGFFLNITLECVKHVNYPSLENGTTANNYTVHWKTDAACPSVFTKGVDCEVKNAYYENPVNFSRIHKENSDYTVLVGDESFRINICGHLNQSCYKTSDASVCYKNKHGKEYAIGLVGYMEPVFKDGEYIFHLEGEPCNDKVTRSKIKIIMSCEYSEDDRPHIHLDPEYFGRVNECEFYFLWKTNVMCTESVSTNCSIQVNNTNYDLSPLKNMKENYIVELNSTTKIVLNVCHSIVPGHRIRCLYSSGACLVKDNVEYILSDDYQQKKMYENLGVVNDLEYTSGQIKLVYSNGGICELGPDGSVTTTIIFKCNETANDTFPNFDKNEKCDYFFTWSTQAACPISPNNNKTSTLSNETKMENNQECITHGEKKYDLSALMIKDWNVENKDIIIGICHPVRSSGCPKNSGACSLNEESGENIGFYNTNLKYEDGSLYLLYKAPNVQTKIQFVCSTMNYKPKFIEEKKTKNGYTTFISWPTRFACDKEVEDACCRQIDHICDVYDGTYNVSLDTTQSVFLSVCRPVIPDLGLLCPNSAASCIATEWNNSFIDEKSLGRVSQKPIINKDKSIILNYLNGSICDGAVRYSSSIRFYCDKKETNAYPKYVRTVNNCHYEFNWGTNLLCSEHDNCTLPYLNKSSSSYSNVIGKDLHLEGQKGNYIISLCKPSTECGSFICKSNSGEAWFAFAGVLNKTESLNKGVVYYFNSPDKKTDGICGAKVKLICDSNYEVGLRQISFEKEEECYVELVLKDEVACSLPKAEIKTNTEDIKTGSAWYVIPLLLIFSVVGLSLAIIYLRNKRPAFIDSLQNVFYYRRLNRRPSSATSLFVKMDADEDSHVHIHLN